MVLHLKKLLSLSPTLNRLMGPRYVSIAAARTPQPPPPPVPEMPPPAPQPPSPPESIAAETQPPPPPVPEPEKVAETLPALFTAETLRSAAKQSMPISIVPVRLRRAIKKFLREEDGRYLRKSVLRLSQLFNELKYRNRELASSTSRELIENPTKSPDSSKRWKITTSYGDMGLVYNESETIAYVASRMPAVYSACYRVLREVHRRLPDFSPTKVLDFGSGTGSVFWALREVWPRASKEINFVEPSKSMQRAALSLIQDMKNLPLIQSYDSTLALLRKIPKPERKHDLVIASYVLGEIASLKDRITTVRQLWGLTRDVLVLVEPGTPQGSSIISQMRSHILWMEERNAKKLQRKVKAGPDGVTRDLVPNNVGAYVVAPCPHDGPCPLANTGKYCHFVQRLQRTSMQRRCKRTKGPLRGFEDEKFSYVVIRKGRRPQGPWPLDGMVFETLKEQKARTLEDLKIEREDLCEDEPDDILLEEDLCEDARDDIPLEEGLVSHDTDVIETDTVDENDGVNKRGLIVCDSDMSETDADEESDEEEENAVHAAPVSGWGRILFDPIRRGRLVEVDVCRSIQCDAKAGCFERVAVTKSKNPTLHQQARKSQWGDLWPC